MPRKKKKPAYTLHRPSGRGRTRIDGKDHYFAGPFDSPLSKAAYDELVGKWLKVQQEAAPSATGILTIDNLVLMYLDHARGHYRKNREPTSEVNCIAQATRPLIRLYGETVASQFGPKSLRLVRDAMINAGLARTSINIHIGRIRRMFKWGVAEEMLPVEAYQRLCTLTGLEAGRSDAKEPDPVRPVSQVMVNAVCPFVSRQIWGMIQVQLAAAMRPGEVTQMRGCDLNMTEDVWTYTPRTHKTSHKGKVRIVHLGKRAQAVIREFLKPDLQAHLFDPREARAEFVAAKYRAGSKVARRGRRFPKEHFSVEAYETAIRRGCEHAFGMPDHLRKIDKKLSAEKREELKRQAAEWRKQWCWHPHQLRHSAATMLRKEFGIELARLALGHSTLAMTEVYAQPDFEKVKAAMAVVG
jgi:integrase